MGEGYLQMPATRLAEVAAARGWSAGQVQSAQRLIDGGVPALEELVTRALRLADSL